MINDDNHDNDFDRGCEMLLKALAYFLIDWIEKMGNKGGRGEV